jgi:PST family polysaccharide transporter
MNEGSTPPRTWTTAAVEGITATVRQAWRRDVFHYSFSLAAVQGAVFVAQMIVARLLGPAEFGYVRVVDTVMALVLVPAGFGLTSAIVRWTAMAPDERARGSILSFSIVSVVAASALVAAIALLILPYTTVNATAQSYLRWLVWSVVFTNVGRLIINYYQGRKEIRRVALLNVVLAGAGTTLVVLGAWWWRVPGWAAGRMGAEILLALVLLWIVRRQLARPAPWQAGKALLAFGASVVASGALDRIATQADTLYLDAFVRDSVIIGQYGAASLAFTAAALLPAAAIAVALPHLSERARDPAAIHQLAMKMLGRLIAGAVLLAALLAVLGPPALRLVLGSQYALAGSLLPWFALALVLNVIMSFLGTYLLALGKAGLTVWQSAIGVGVNIGANAILMPTYGVHGAVWAAILTAGARGACLWLFLWWILRHPAARPQAAA